MKTCYTSKNEPFLIDDEDYPFVSQRAWGKDKNGYLIAQFNYQKVKLHRAIMGFPIGMEIDHIDGDNSNNQKSNLRICTHAQNMQNTKVRTTVGKTSKYKGVYYVSENRNHWLAYVHKAHKCVWRQVFNTEKAAALAYNEHAKLIHGEYALLNIIPK